jgi:hypothetical protein
MLCECIGWFWVKKEKGRNITDLSKVKRGWTVKRKLFITAIPKYLRLKLSK